MADIKLYGTLHNVTGDPAVRASEIYDETQEANQNTINAQILEAIGEGGSIETQIDDKINALDATASQEASTDGLSLEVKEQNGKITEISGSIAPNTYDPHGAASTVKTEVVGGATDDYNTLGKIEGKLTHLDSHLETFEDEVMGLVSTPHDGRVTVSAVSTTTAATDVLPASGQSADTIYRVSNWDGNANSGAGGYDVTAYSEYAWDDVSVPNKYVLLCVKTQIGEVFDISEYKAVGGTLATFTTLSDALGTNGANVPVGIRKGGMSIKFVQSIDNKYVQYRLMSDEWSTNVYDWQTVVKEQVSQTFVTTNQLVGRTHELFELGNIAGIENDGTLTYDDTNIKRVRLLKNTYMYFSKGDRIGLKDYTLNMRYLVIGIDNDGVTHNLGWKTADYIFEYSGRYGIIMDIVVGGAEQTITDVVYLAQNLKINPMDITMNGNLQFLTGTLKPNVDTVNGTIQFYESNLFIGNKHFIIPAQTIPLYVNDNDRNKSYMLVVNVNTGTIASRYVGLAVDITCEAVLGNYVLNYLQANTPSTSVQYTYWTFIKDNNFVFDYTVDNIDFMSDGREYERKYLAELQKTHGTYIVDIKGFMACRVKQGEDASSPTTRLWIIIPAYKVARVRVNSLSSDYYWTFNAFSNREDCISRFINSLDGGIIGWQTTPGTALLRYSNFYYLKLAFKRADDGELTAADFAAILNSINVEIWTGTAVNDYYQSIDSIYNDIYGTKITDITNYDHVLAWGSKRDDRLRFFIPANRDVTVAVGWLLSGFQWTINAFRSYEDAVNTVNPLDGGSLPWTSNPGTYSLAYDEMTYLRLNFKKANDQAITTAEANNIIASILITILTNSQSGIKKQVEYLFDNIAEHIDLSTAYLCDINNTNIGDYNLLSQIFRISPDSVITLKAKNANPVVTTHIDIGNDDLMYDWSKRIFKDLWSSGDKVVSNENYGGRIAMILFKKGDATSGSLSEPVTLADILADYDLYISNLVPWNFSQNLTARIGSKASAHRGVQVNDIPQESNEAYMMAARCHFDECEADVCVTSDGKFVMSHDTTLSSTLIEYADGTQIESPIAINSLTFEQVRTNFRLKSNNPIYRQQIPSFEEYLQICCQYEIYAFPEIKNNPISNALCENFLNLCLSYLPKDKFCIQSWNYDALDYIRSLDDEVNLCYVDIDIRNTNNTVTNQPRFTRYTHAMFRESGATTNLSAEIVEAYRKNGSMVWDGTLVKPNMFSDSVQNNACPTVITETCGPNLLGRNGIHFNSKTGWDWFYTDGTVANGVLTLNTNQVLAFTTRFGYIGGIILDIKFKGSITIKSQQANVNKGLNKSVTSASEYKHLIERVLVYNNTGSFYIKATADNTVIESIDFQYAELV